MLLLHAFHLAAISVSLLTHTPSIYLQARNDVEDLNMRDDDDRHFILQIALKCADISNPCRTWSTCRTWSNRVCDEFFQQGR